MAMSDRITLNVGGVRYQTTRSTLCSYKGSMLEKMFDGNFKEKPDEDGSYFIDRDGELFKYVLHVLRNGKITVKNIAIIKEDRINIELDYFGLPLVNYIENGTRSLYPLVSMEDTEYELLRYSDDTNDGLRLEILENGYNLTFGDGTRLHFSLNFQYRIKIIYLETRSELSSSGRKTYVLKYRTDFQSLSSSSSLNDSLSFSSNQPFDSNLNRQLKLIHKLFVKYW